MELLYPRRSDACVRTWLGSRALLALVLVLLVASCSGGRDNTGSAATVLAADRLQIATDDGWSAVAVGDSLAGGTRVRVVRGEARLEFPTGEAWLAEGSAGVLTPAQLELLRGDAILASGGTLGMKWTDVTVAGAGVYRVTPGVSPHIGVYSGKALDVRRGQQAISLDNLREVDLASPVLAAGIGPLSYREDDQWDQLLLGPEIAFDAEIARLGQGLDRQYGTDPRPSAFYSAFAEFPSSLVPVLAEAARTRLDTAAFGPPSDVLLTLFVAQAGVRPPLATLERATVVVTDLRGAGAKWGLVAQRLGIGTGDLARTADLAMARFTQQSAVAGAVPAAPQTDSVAGAPLLGALGPLTPPSTTVGPAPAAPAAPGPSAPPPPAPTPDPVIDLPLPPVAVPGAPDVPGAPVAPGTINGLIDSVTQPVEAITDTVNQTLSDVLGPLLP